MVGYDYSSIVRGLDRPPKGDKLTQWIGGVVFPIPVAAVGVCFIVAQWYAFGAFVCFASAFLHFHYFWGLTEKYLFVSTIGKNGAALAMILCLGYGAYCFILAF